MFTTKITTNNVKLERTNFTAIAELNRVLGLPPPLHRQIGIATNNGRNTGIAYQNEIVTNFYTVSLIVERDAAIMNFIQPRQVMEKCVIDRGRKFFVIMIHEEVLDGRKWVIGQREHEFMGREKAIRLSMNESELMWSIYYGIERELIDNQDEHTIDIVLSYVYSMMMYADRFYKRQLVTQTTM